MKGPTHKMGGQTATLITMTASMVMLKQLPQIQQLGLLILTYPTVRWICELTCLLADTDANIENTPVRNDIGFIFFGLAKKLGVTHRGAPIHAIMTYVYTCGLPALLTIVLFYKTKMLLMYAISTVLLACFLGFMSHLYLDGMTTTGVYKDTKGKSKIRFYKNKTRKVRSIKFTTFAGIIPIVTFKVHHMHEINRVTGGDYEKLIKDNIYNINRLFAKIILILFVLNISALTQTIKILIKQ